MNNKYEGVQEGFKEKSTCLWNLRKNKITKINFGKRIDMYFFWFIKELYEYSDTDVLKMWRQIEGIIKKYMSVKFKKK